MTDHRDYDVKVEGAKPERPVPDWESKSLAGADWLDARLGIRFWTLTGLVVASLIFGTPHMLIQYQCYGRCGKYATEFNCQYLGMGGWKVAPEVEGKCPRVRLL
jgi:hypothetical protein